MMRSWNYWSQLVRLWHFFTYCRRLAKAQANLRTRAVSPEPSLFAHMKYRSRRRVRPKIKHLAPLDGCACAFEEWVYGMTTSLGEDAAGRCADRLLVCPYFVVSRFSTLPLGARGRMRPLIIAVPGDLTMLWIAAWQNQQMTCAPSEDSDQPGHPPVWSDSSLCAQLAVKGPMFLHADSEDWLDWADAQAHLSLRWAHRSFCWFCHAAAQL